MWTIISYYPLDVVTKFRESDGRGFINDKVDCGVPWTL